ncbi:MAG TPA: hypothetical protein VEO74_04195 [Thermoanaerobaculia bacterium]|nr:hypothetical protein [Thermoanaerobaculia bacterium]
MIAFNRAHRDEELLVDGDPPSVLGCIPFAVTAIEKSPCRNVDAKSVLQRLKDDVPLVGAEAVDAQGGECESMRGVIREVEAAFSGDHCLAGVFQPSRCSRPAPASW